MHRIAARSTAPPLLKGALTWMVVASQWADARGLPLGSWRTGQRFQAGGRWWQARYTGKRWEVRALDGADMNG